MEAVINRSFLRFPALGFIGLANAFPMILAGPTLALWLTELGFQKNEIGFLALLGIPFSLKLLWVPVVDHIKIPFCQKYPRKSWILVALLGMALSLWGISVSQHSFATLIVSLLVLFSFAGCLHVVGLAYELESMEETSYSFGSAWVIGGYRAGLLLAGAGALYFSILWDWQTSYTLMALLLILGALLLLFLPEPVHSIQTLQTKTQKWLKSTNILSGFWQELVREPCKMFFRKHQWLTFIFVIMSFKMGDQMIKNMEGIFFLSLGFDKVDIATASKVWGLTTTLIGAFLAGILFKGKDFLKSLATIGLVHASSLIFYSLLCLIGKSYVIFYLVLAIVNFTGGMAMTAFISLLWKMCDKAYAPLQYTLLWSLYLFKTDLLAWIGGIVASQVEWPLFFIIATSISILSASLTYLVVNRWASNTVRV